MFGNSPQKQVMWLIAGGILARLALAGAIGLGVDESYVTAIARNFEWSYFDHPPLHFWIIWLTAKLTGSESAIVLRLPFILLFAGTTFMVYLLGKQLFGERAGLLSAVVLNISAVFSLSSGSWLLPDGPLMFFMAAAVLLLARMLFSQNGQLLWQWAFLGVLTGLGMLSKYHAVFILIGGFLFLLTSPNYRKILATPGPYLTAVVAGIVFLPVIAWNWEHGWISFLFQSGRGAVHGFYPQRMLANIAGQAVWVLPWIWLPLVWALGKAVLERWSVKSSVGERQWFLCCLALGPIVLFTAAVLWGAQGLFHWQAPGYLLAMPLLGRLAGQWFERGSRLARGWLACSAAVFIGILLFLGSHTANGWLRQAAPAWFAHGDPTVEALDWKELPQYVQSLGLGDSRNVFIVAPHWIDAGKVDYIMGGKLPVMCFADEPHHFGLKYKQADFKGRDALLIGRREVLERNIPNYRAYFQTVESVGNLPITRGGYSELNLAIYYGRNYNGGYPLPYGSK